MSLISFQMIGMEQVQKRITQLPRRADDFIDQQVAWALRRLERAWKKQASGKRLKVRSGLYRDSIIVDESKTQIENRVVYAAIQEYGGTIRPRKGRYLTIPLKAALTRRGVLRKPARKWADTFVARSKAGNLIIFRDDGIPLFVLKRKVTLKNKNLTRHAQAEAMPEIRTHIKDSSKKMVSDLFKGKR